MIKLFISQPMRGKSDAEIQQERDRIFRQVSEDTDDQVELIDSFFRGYEDEHPLVLLGRSIELMSQADLVYFAVGWEESRGCLIECKCAEAYGKQAAFEIDYSKNPGLQEKVEAAKKRIAELMAEHEV